MLGRFGSMIMFVVTIVGLCAVAVLFTVMQVSHIRMYRVATDSMQPYLRPGEVVFTRPLKSWPKVGQVVSYRSIVHPGEVVSHRILSIDESRNYIVVQGDHEYLPDAPIKLQQVIGVVVWQSVPLGKLMSVLRTPQGLIGFIYLPSLLLIVYELRRLLVGHRESRRYQVGKVIRL